MSGGGGETNTVSEFKPPEYTQQTREDYRRSVRHHRADGRIVWCCGRQRQQLCGDWRVVNVGCGGRWRRYGECRW